MSTASYLAADALSTIRWQLLASPSVQAAGIKLWLCQLHTAQPLLAGNKCLKLKYHIQQIQQLQCAGILTFGGAYSNHLAAVAAVCQQLGLKSHALLRADSLDPKNPTVTYCLSQGMTFSLLSREQYRTRQQTDFLQQLKLQYADLYLVPEGGSSSLGVQGVAELPLALTPAGQADLICCASASGGTLAGIALGQPHCQVLGISVLRDSSLSSRVQQLITDTLGKDSSTMPGNWHLTDTEPALAYGKFSQQQLQFCLEFKRENGITLEPVYTGKAMHKLYQLINSGHFARGSRLVFFHTGGLQGLAGLYSRGKISQADYVLLSAPEAD
ncbi:1-aminocyclopropane-1-carboxylate deaminase/D-cysteine desulfhydrase [Arsukibacterium sp.]|uniref:1-aminocyclopropane-1-carboxylate deaminase/D-cysteine desulfhydrase n=1 Tax=Arsukibacterium sp. TaxID=1977258 RepID=UPI002FD9BF8A